MPPAKKAATATATTADHTVRTFLPITLHGVLQEPETGAFDTEEAYLRTLEALVTLEVQAYKLTLEVNQRATSFASREFGDAGSSGVHRAMDDSYPLCKQWVERLRKRVEVRGALPLKGTKLKARFVRVCDVYELSPTECRILAALLMLRASHAFTAVKIGSTMGYGGGGGMYAGSGTKSGVTIASILGVSLGEISAFQKPERKHVKQGVLVPGVQLLTELPNLQQECVLLLIALPLTESQVFNIEKTDLMRVLREEPGFDESKLAPKKSRAALRDAATAAANNPPHVLSIDQINSGTAGVVAGSSSLYSLLQMEVAAEARVVRAGNGGGNGGGGGGLGALGLEETASPAAAVEEADEMESEATAEAAAAANGKRGKRGSAGAGAAAAAAVEPSRKRGRSASAAATEAGTEATADAATDQLASLSDKSPSADKGKGKAVVAAADAKKPEADEGEETPKPRNGPYESDLEYLQDLFQLVKLRADIARVRRHMEERGQQIMRGGGSGGGGEGADGENESDDDMPPSMGYDEGYWGLDEYSYEMEALSRGRFGRNLRHEHSKQARHEVKRARKLQSRADRLHDRIQTRLGTMTDAKPPMRLPRLERLSSALGLCDFEKNVVVAMIGQAIAPRSIGLMGGGGGGGGGGGSPSKTMQVEVLLRAFSHSLQAQIEHRKHFYKSAVLVREGILVLHGDELGADLTQTLAEIDRRMLDFVVGLDTEFSELMDGSHLYTPSVSIDEVVLAEAKKTLVLDTVKHFDTFTQASRQLELSKKLAYGRGLVLLFYGPSGTGKTMMANALAALIGKKVLMINFPALGANSAGAILKLVFREAKIHDAILFFDECESIFMDRTKGNLQVNTVLTELERHEGLCILATNRPMDLDEAMHRRITLAIEFTKPDLLLREKIWRSMAPPKLPLASDVDFMTLARKYELQGGFIKNAWLSALSIAVARDGLSPTVTMEDLHSGASHQLRGRLAMSNFDRGIVPQQGLESVILPNELKEKLKQIVNYSKAQAVLFGQWGFQQQHGRAQGISALFHGPPGTGKTMAAEAIGFDVGRPLMVVNMSQLIDKYVGESAKNIEKVFAEAKGQDAVLVFDEAEGLFAQRSSEGGSTSRHDSMNVGVLLHHMEEFSGIVVAITNQYLQIDTAFHRRFKFIMEFPVPDQATRAKLWRSLIPPEAPLCPKVDFDELGARFDLSGGHIKSAVFRAAVEASLQAEGEQRLITMDRLCSAAKEEVDKDGDGKRPAGMYT